MSIFAIPDLKQLLNRCKSGDSAAWELLVDQFSRLVYSVPKKLGLNKDDSADVFQATFLALYRNLDRLNDAQALPKWLAVSASREALRIKRVNSRSTSSDETSLEDIVAGEERGAEELSVAAAESDLVQRGLAQLGGRCKELLELLYAQEKAAYGAISEKLNMPIGAIGPTRARCLDKLRKILSEKGFF
jgi:RNA polymerase sigma factor (sigma-70 family)